MAHKQVLKNAGQATIEVVILMALIVTVWSGVNKVLSKSGAFNAIFGEPWLRLKNVVEFGVPTENGQSGAAHPASIERHSTRVKKL